MTTMNSSTLQEPVRLVVWDLDETFWKGTLTEGGISEYVQEHHDAIVELAHRGIMSSICSKNSADQVLPILENKKILEYLIFPSISWQPKGERLAALIKQVQMRPASVMYIDDNPGNLAEASARIPGIQVEGVDFIAHMLDDPRFEGKDDAGLTRLAQYKMLETRNRDETQYCGDNSEFLRSCDIRVYIEHDVLGNIERAIELINRTNQLNYTKDRLPEDPERARVKLTRQCAGSKYQAGLVRVMDRYGDHGFVGFYLLRNRRADPGPGLANQTLVHYCFSCRTLGMYVEKWLYDQLRRPALEVVGEVLTDISEPRTVDWIRQVPSVSEGAVTRSKLAPEIRVIGGCEANSVAHYLGAYCDRVTVTGNFQAGALFVRTNSCFLLLSAADHADDKAFEEEMALLGIPAPLMGTSYFQHAPEGTIFVFNGGFDAQSGVRRRMRHRDRGYEFHAKPGRPSVDIIPASEDEITGLIAGVRSDDERRQIELIVRHVRENYELVGDTGNSLEGAMEELVGRVPQGCKLVIVLDDERRRSKRGGISIVPERVRYKEWVRRFAEQFPFVGIVALSDAIQSEDEIFTGGNHYAREVYWRAAEQIVQVARLLAARQSPVSHASVDCEEPQRSRSALQNHESSVTATVRALSGLTL